MRKGFFSLILLFSFFTILGSNVLAEEIKKDDFKEKTVTFTIGQKNYKIGDMVIETDVAPYIKDLANGGGRIMVPVAYVAPALGTEPARWYPNDRLVLITKGDKQIAGFIDKKELLVNGKKMPMDVAAEITDIGNGGRTMLPIAFIAKALEVGYEWDEAARSVYFYGYSRIYDQKGTFGPEYGIETIDGNVVVKTDEVTLQNMLIKGNLTIAEEVGEGDVTLNNITVKGETYIRGGGKDSIHINGGQYSNIIIQNVNGAIRVVATDVTGAQVVVAEEAQGQEITLEGTFDKVTIEAKDALILTQGKTTIMQLIAAETAMDTEIRLDKDSIVVEMILLANVNVQGQGSIQKVVIKANGVHLGITPKELYVDPGVTPPTILDMETGHEKSGLSEATDPQKAALDAVREMNKTKDASGLTTEILLTAGIKDVDEMLLEKYKEAVENTTTLKVLKDLQNLVCFVNAQANILALIILDSETGEIIGIIEGITLADIDAAQNKLNKVSPGYECYPGATKAVLENLMEKVRESFNKDNSQEVPIPITDVTLDRATMTLKLGQEEGILTATVFPDNATDKNLIWSSSDTGVATVTDGVVTPVSMGTAVITVTTQDGNFSAQCTVNVIAPGDIIGAGTESDPYIIYTFTGLEKIGKEGYALDAHYILGADIDASCTKEQGNKGWQPIGNKPDNCFSGVFDGRNYKITNLYINNSLVYTGFFGYLRGTVMNLELENVNIKGSYYVGSLAGQLAGGSIINVKVSGSVEGLQFVGGLVGGDESGSNGEIRQCSSAVKVEAGNFYSGGLVGHANGMVISDSRATGNISGNSAVGGLVGWAINTEIVACYTNGDVSSKDSKTGGLIGTCSSTVIRDSYARGEISGKDKVGGLVGYCSLSTITNSWALNPEIKAVPGLGTYIYFGRIIGCVDGNNLLENNFANKHMVEPFEGAFNAKNPNAKDGGDLESYDFDDEGKLIITII
ncbi:MAG: hypothetical protein GXW85_08640 [Clostridia bacterium]|nr:hypothetical protein [Clostridia bacterium]